VEHDDINVLVLGGPVIGAALARELVEVFLATRYTHEERRN
jgi:ribose 5-phosphate isomerase RpiB